MVLDDNPGFVYQGGCLTESEMLQFLKGEYDYVTRDEVNYHVCYCTSCTSIAKKLIEQEHDRVRKEWEARR